MRLEPARPEDSLLLWRWRNDPQTRANSRSSDPVSWEEHAKWFKEKQNIYVAWVPVGTVRVDDGEVSLTVAPEHRGNGYAAPMIRAANGVRAWVKADNEPSLRAFRSAGYWPWRQVGEMVEMTIDEEGPHY